MEIDYSKENIQPLRGGRNVSQLETALQAQSDSDLQRELLQQKGAFEEAIQTYVGDDPLDNWYNYISWVEQSYPKHGHEGNLVAVLEDCVSTFENDERYRNDPRMCKLWIKYIDLQQNPLELFPCLHVKGIGVSCADLYKAWAYYHEVAEDYKRADAVFKMGLSVFAQPYGELVAARDNMHLTFAKQTLQGVDVDERLAETRHALTSLRTYKESHRTVVPSVRNEQQILQPTPGAIPMMAPLLDQQRNSHSNVTVTPYEDLEVAGPSIGAAGTSNNILEIARKQAFIQKENTLKPGTWKQNIVTKKVPQHRDPSFKVHEDEDPQYVGGIRLLPNHYTMNHDDFAEWKVGLFFPEPHDPRHVPMYPKHLVYAESEVEYSLEEIRARKYATKKRQLQSMELSSMQETMMEEANSLSGQQMHVEAEQAVQSMRPSVGMEEHHQMIHQMHHTQSTYPIVMEHHSANYNQQWEHGAVSSNSNYRHHDDVHQELPAKIVRSSIYQPQNDPRIGDSINNSNSQAKYVEPRVQPLNWSADMGEPSSSNSTYRHRDITHQELFTKIVRTSIYQPQNDSNSQVKYVETRKQPSNWLDATISNNANYSDVNDHVSGSNSSNPSYRHHDDSHQELPTKIVRSSIYQPQNDPRIAESINNSNSQVKYIETRKQAPNWSDSMIGSDVNDRRSGATSSNPTYHDDPHQELPTKVVRSSIYQPQVESNSQVKYVATSKQPSNWTDATISSDTGNFSVNTREAIKDINEIWKDNLSALHQEPLVNIEVKKPEMVAFQIHEDTKLDLPDEIDPSYFLPRKSVLKPAPVILADGEDVENKPVKRFSIYEEDNACSSSNLPVASRISQGLRQSMTSGPTTGCRTPFSKQKMFDDDKFARPAEVVNNKKIPFAVFEDEPQAGKVVDLDDSCTTQTFNFNLNSNKASTPCHMKKIAHTAQPDQPNNVEATRHSTSKKVLFNESDHEFSTRVQTEKLSTIFENSKESRNSSSSLSSGGTTTLKTTFHRESLKVIPEMSLTDSSTSHEQSTSNYHVPSQTTTADNNPKQQKTVVSRYNLIKMLLTEDSEEIGVSVRENNYESPMKNQFKAMSCDSNDGSSSVKVISRMDADFHNLIPNNLECKMDHETHESIKITHTTPAKSRLSLEDEQILNQPITDPFSSRLNNALLNKMNFPFPKYSEHFYNVQSLPRLVGKKETVFFLHEKYVVLKLIGKGAFASVYKAENVLTNEMVALKHEKPANRWEYYIVQEIRERLSNPYLLQAYMEVSACYISKTASVLVSEYCKFGSLLDLTNKVKQTTGKGLKELVAIYYANEIITIINALHQCKIIHGDIKPDNFLVTRMPPVFGYPSLKLIDFGNSIDMSLFPDGTSFKKAVSTENFICTEMKDGRQWTYQTDIFCIAATIHVLLFDKYMQVQRSGKIWAICQHIPRYMRTDLWKPFFFQMLNIDNCSNLPDLAALKGSFESIISSQSEELQMDMRFVANKF